MTSSEGHRTPARNSLPTVAHMVWTGDVGGIERLVYELVRSQRATGTAAMVAFGQDRGLVAESMHRHGIPVLDLGLASGYDLRPMRLHAAASALAQADLIHLHSFNLPLAAVAIAARRPIIFTDHGYFGKPGLRGRILRLGRRMFLRRACRAIAANSTWTASRLTSGYNLDPSRISVVHNGIAVQRAPQTIPARSTNDSLVVAFVGRLAAFKRVDLLLKAVSLARRRKEIRTLIIGSGPLGRELRTLASRLGLEETAEFLGRRSDVAPILAATDVIVQPSQAEPFGLAIVEACLQGALPIVFADGGGALEVLPPDGLVASDEADLAGLLDELVDDRDPLDGTARRARSRWAADHFSIDRTAASYLDLYLTALGEGT
jgi:glycosyltransferase involved in cell wall biosynthesis